MATDAAAVERRLRAILEPYADRLDATRNGSTGYELQRRGDTSPASLFAATRIGKRYVSFYLMPVYMHAELLAGTTDGLRRRMQGKSCFNFTNVDETLFAELAALTDQAYATFESPAYPRTPASTRSR